MGQKVHPTGLRLGIIKDHTSVWYADGPSYSEKLHEDLAVRAFLQKKLAQASVSRIEIKRPAQTARVTIHTARPGIVIGKKGEDVERLRQEIAKMMRVPVHINIEEIRKPECRATVGEKSSVSSSHEAGNAKCYESRSSRNKSKSGRTIGGRRNRESRNVSRGQSSFAHDKGRCRLRYR